MSPPTIIEVYTPLLIGSSLSSILYGVTVLQMYTYYQTSKHDPLWIKFFVFYLFLAETANTVCNIGIVFEPLILRYGTEFPLVISPLLLRSDAIMTVIISTPVQLFMAWRIKIIAESVIPSIVIGLFSLASLGGGIATTVCVTMKPAYRQFAEFKAAPSTWLVASAITDVLVTIFLVYSLWRKRTSISSDIVSRLIRFNVQTGTITAVAALADAIVFLSVKDTTIFFSWDLCIAKLYAISLLSSLNARMSALASKVYEPNPLFSSSQSSSNSDRRPTAGMSFGLRTTNTTNTNVVSMPATDPEDVDDMDVPLKRQEGSGIYVEQEIISSRV